MKLKKVIPWIPAIITVLLAAVTCVIYSVGYGAPRGAIGYILLFGWTLPPVLLPAYGVIFKRPIPVAVTALVAVQVVLAVFCGTNLDLYNRISWWDLFMHCSFGFVGGVLAYAFLMRWGGGKIHKVLFYTFIFCFVITFSALWEIAEFICDGIFFQNAQVADGLYGREAVRDTMEDLIITFAGIAVFLLAVLVDKLSKLNFMQRLFCNEVGRTALKQPCENQTQEKEKNNET